MLVRSLILLAPVGLAAQLVDGSSGHGLRRHAQRPCCSRSAPTPAAASATVHLAEIGTSLGSGISQSVSSNVDWKVVPKIGILGAIGEFAGATFLSSLSIEAAAPGDVDDPAGAGGLHLHPLHRRRPAERNPLRAVAVSGSSDCSASSPASSTPRAAAAGARSAPRRSWPAGAIHPRKVHQPHRHQRVPGRHRRQHRLPHRYRLKVNIDFAWVAACSWAVARSPRPSQPGWCRYVPPRHPRPGGWAASSSSTNVRTPLRSELGRRLRRGAQAAAYITIAVLWAAAIACSVNEYRKDKEHSSPCRPSRRRLAAAPAGGRARFLA